VRNHYKAPLLWQVHPVVFLHLYFLQGISGLTLVHSTLHHQNQSDQERRRSYLPIAEAMAQKTLQEFSVPSLENIPTGPRFAVEEGAPEFELKSSLINLVQATPFNGKAHEDASAHLENFLEIGSTIHIDGVDKDVILLCLFPFSLEGKARKWFYTHQDNINNWTNLSDAFLLKFFPIGKTTALRRNIVSFQ